MSRVRVGLQDARAALVEELKALSAAVVDLDDAQLLEPSGCRGWNVADVLVHVHLGLHELLLGLVAPLVGETAPVPDLDAASYWRSPVPTNDSGADGLDALRFVQRVAASYRRPGGLVAHLRPTIAGVVSAVSALPDVAVSFQGHSLAAGDLMATWAVELAVHHLDLGCAAHAPSAGALQLARETAEALLGEPLPRRWLPYEAVLIATGRQRPDPAQLVELGDGARRQHLRRLSSRTANDDYYQ